MYGGNYINMEFFNTYEQINRFSYIHAMQFHVDISLSFVAEAHMFFVLLDQSVEM